MKAPPEFRVAAQADGVGHYYPSDAGRPMRVVSALCGAAPSDPRFEHPVAERCGICKAGANELTIEALRGPMPVRKAAW